MITLIVLIAGFIGAVGIGAALGRGIYLKGHRAGFTAGRAEGYRAGLARLLPADRTGRLAAGWTCTPGTGYCAQSPGLPCLAPDCYSD